MKLFHKFAMSLLGGMGLLLLMSVTSCSHSRMKPIPEEQLLLEQFRQKAGSEFTQVRLVSGEFTLEVTDIQALDQDSLITDNRRSGIPDSTLPSLHIWSADLAEYPTQFPLHATRIQPESDSVFFDIEYGNRILYWNLSPSRNIDSIRITRSFQYVTFDYRPDIDPLAEHQNWHSIPPEIIEQYTRPELFLEQDAALVDTVFALLQEIPDPVSQARRLYDWVQSSLTYIYPPEARGVRNALSTRAGDCGQYSALFITMARIAGIPARQQSGFNFYAGNTGAHVWSEIYLPVKGWVPVDATREDGFLHLDNGRLITSQGLNIPLENAPEWATFNNSEVQNGKTDFHANVHPGFQWGYSLVFHQKSRDPLCGVGLRPNLSGAAPNCDQTGIETPSLTPFITI